MSAQPDRYRSLENGPEIESRVRSSRFLGQAFRIATAEEGTTAVAALRRTYHDATHHCWALRLGPPEGPFERSDDNGEPSGTAGAPILAELRRTDTFDALVVVTRYFGGTKLGTGGLARAYAEAAHLAVASAPERFVWRESRLRVSCAYEDLGIVEGVLAREASSIRNVERDFSARPTFVVTTLRNAGDRLRTALIEATAARADISGPSVV
jgi:uncharacterized YigZ family protein